MRRFLLLLGYAAILCPLSTAQSLFEGTWKADMSKIDFPTKPDVWVLQNGTFECKTCIPPYTIKTDGTDQAIPGDPNVDTIAITIISDRETRWVGKKNGKVVFTSTDTLSPDGNTDVETETDSSAQNGEVTTATIEIKKVAPGPPRSNPLSGSWVNSKVREASDNGSLWTYKLAGNELTMTTPTGQSYTAKLDGTEAPFKGDPGLTTVRVKLVDPTTLEETGLRNGKVIYVNRMTVSSDGKTALVVSQDKQRDTTMKIPANKQ